MLAALNAFLEGRAPTVARQKTKLCAMAFAKAALALSKMAGIMAIKSERKGYRVKAQESAKIEILTPKCPGTLRPNTK